jgi:hypothetical protein
MRRGDSVELEGKDDRDRSDRICCSSQVQLRTKRELDVTYFAWWSCGDAFILTASWHL